MHLRNKLYDLRFVGDGTLSLNAIEHYRTQLAPCLATAGVPLDAPVDEAAATPSSSRQKRSNDGDVTPVNRRKRVNLGDIVPAGMTAPPP